MLGWMIAGVLLVCLIGYAGMDYTSKGAERKALRVLSAENKRLKRYIDEHPHTNDPDTLFAATFEDAGMDSLEDSLHRMISRAQTEIIIVSPWIKERVWERINKRVVKFVNNGGQFTLIVKGAQEDFDRGTTDLCVIEEIRRMGCVVRFVPKLHAKLYVVDRREALITSANLTRGGFDHSYEAGVWTSNPVIVNDVLTFIDNLAG